ncbi:fructose-bisphosphate aldolase, class I [Pedobacter westerhofensis]|uniref:Probable fructose-bisphosphate aldolase class 1 n=1 Tax=Pedobacter westerhofensis TaxID=425512 RepID=A0A521AVU2_9SPHI|nr:class I fructose-bisphosphate aldolase [Pedobacter westerhofensis]SMO38904.1 fructose-bisphosphate aldolase, class I [Pedobacter westerhofensis]
MENKDQLIMTAKAMVADYKGLVAIDESVATLNKRFEAAGIPQTEAYRRAYREVLITTPGIGDYINGAILFDETVYQQTLEGVNFIDALNQAGVIPGIKLDEGVEDLPGFPAEKVTKGLDDLAERLIKYKNLGLRFAKWRAVILIDASLPSEACIVSNAHALARYAAACQHAGIVPIVEPEVIMDGDHSIERCAEVTASALRELFYQLNLLKVELRGLVLKPNMVLPGKDNREKAEANKVAELTVTTLLNAVPASVAGIAFLSGGQDPESASGNLNAINLNYKTELPWPVTYSFSRALHQPALEIWAGKDENVKAAQASFLELGKANHLARKGEFVHTDITL